MISYDFEADSTDTLISLLLLSMKYITLVRVFSYNVELW